MNNVYDYAKYFLKKGADSQPNTYDGNMKLQKMLVLANMIHIAKYGKPLFDEKILAFENGCVVEGVRLRYKSDYFGFKSDSDMFEPDFTEEEYDTLNAALGIFGHVSARELSGLNHEFASWKRAYEAGKGWDGFHDKERSVVDLSLYPEDIAAVKRAVDAYARTQECCHRMETINGVTFYIDGMKMTENLLSRLEEFSLACEDGPYSVCMDGERLVIY